MKWKEYWQGGFCSCWMKLQWETWKSMKYGPPMLRISRMTQCVKHQYHHPHNSLQDYWGTQMIHSHRQRFNPAWSNMHTEFLRFITLFTQVFSSGRKCTCFRTEVYFNYHKKLKYLWKSCLTTSFFVCVIKLQALRCQNSKGSVSEKIIWGVSSLSFTHTFVSLFPFLLTGQMREPNPAFHTFDPWLYFIFLYLGFVSCVDQYKFIDLHSFPVDLHDILCFLTWAMNSDPVF